MGSWLAVNGEAIYGTGPTLFGPEAGAFSPTEKDRRASRSSSRRGTGAPPRALTSIYIEIFHWPSGSFHLDNVPRTVTGAYLLADPAHAPLTFTQKNAAVDISLPLPSPDPIAAVVVLETTAARP